MTTQDDHGRFSGETARGFHQDWLPEKGHKSDCLLAISEHDRAWIRLDAHPVWNDAKLRPFSFIDYPVQPKLLMYQTGLSETEEMNKYSALLCSMHYASFFESNPDALSEEERLFYYGELERQQRLKAELGRPDEEELRRHFQLLQLCDDISLYVCMNREGAAKDEEHPWFRDGFDSLVDGQQFLAEWVDARSIRISPCPFESEWSAVLRSKHVLKSRAAEVGLNQSYQETEWTKLKVSFVR